MRGWVGETEVFDTCYYYLSTKTNQFINFSPPLFVYIIVANMYLIDSILLDSPAHPGTIEIGCSNPYSYFKGSQ